MMIISTKSSCSISTNMALCQAVQASRAKAPTGNAGNAVEFYSGRAGKPAFLNGNEYHNMAFEIPPGVEVLMGNSSWSIDEYCRKRYAHGLDTGNS